MKIAVKREPTTWKNCFPMVRQSARFVPFDFVWDERVSDHRTTLWTVACSLGENQKQITVPWRPAIQIYFSLFAIAIDFCIDIVSVFLEEQRLNRTLHIWLVDLLGLVIRHRICRSDVSISHITCAHSLNHEWLWICKLGRTLQAWVMVRHSRRNSACVASRTRL
jgi:hypothetical protein